MVGFIYYYLFAATSPTYFTVLNSSSFFEWVTSRIGNESQIWGWKARHRGGDKAQKELLWLCTQTCLAPCSTPGGSPPQRCPSCKTLNRLNTMERSFRKDVYRAHHHGVSCMPKAQVDSNPFFCLRPPQDWGAFAGQTWHSWPSWAPRNVCSLPDVGQWLIHSPGEGSPLNSSFCPSRHTPTSLTYRRVSQLTASTSSHSGSGFLWSGKEGLGSPQVKSRISPDSPALEVHHFRLLGKSLGRGERKKCFSWLCFIRKEWTLCFEWEKPWGGHLIFHWFGL